MRQHETIRAAALPETAIVLSFVLMVMFGAMQIALYGFAQASADGAAFVAANAVADNSSHDPAILGSATFPGVKASAISTKLQGNTVVAQASTTMPGLPFVPGMPSSLTISGADIEANAPGKSTTANFAFGATANLNNYCQAGYTCALPASHAMHLAQNLDYSGNGKNGVFEEWYCHVNTFGAVAFPSTRPTPGPAWDSANPASGAEYSIYQWDVGASC